MSQGHGARWFAASVVLAFAAWMAFVGTPSGQEFVLGGAAAVFSSLLSAFVLKRMGVPVLLHFSDAIQLVWIPWYLATGAWEILTLLVKDIAGISKAHSLFRTAPFECKTGSRGFIRRALAVGGTTAAPNFIVIGIDSSRELMLFHQVERSGVPRMTRHLGAGA